MRVMLSVLAFCILGTGAAPPDSSAVVLAAASLRKPLSDLEAVFESRNAGVKLDISYAGSQELATQLSLGAPADAFLSADRTQIDVAVRAKRISVRDVKAFAGNRLCLLVSERAKNRIQSLNDLTQPDVRLCLAGDRVPVGAYSNEVLAKAGKKFGPTWIDRVRSHVVSFETSVSAIVTRVELGDVDAGIVYETDAMASKKAVGYEIPKEFNIRTTYYLGLVSDGKNLKIARDFVGLVLSKEGQAAFAKYGFLPPK